MLTRDERDHFDTFGFVVRRAAFSSDETEQLQSAAERAYRDLLGREPQPADVIWEPDQVEERDDLRWLSQQRRPTSPAHIDFRGLRVGTTITSHL